MKKEKIEDNDRELTEEEMKSVTKSFMTIAVLLLIIIILLVLVIMKVIDKKKTTINENTTYYNSIEYGQEQLNEDYDKKIIKTYKEYLKFTEDNDLKAKIEEDMFIGNDYVVVYAENDSCGGNTNGIKDVDIKDGIVTVTIGYEATCGPCPSEYKLYLVPVDKTDDDVKVEYSYLQENTLKCDSTEIKKPLIYLYPTEDTEVTIKLGKSENLTTTYPKYNGEWKVLAKSNGTLIDTSTNKEYYGLYWESNDVVSNNIQDGFIVKGEDTSTFLEEKLQILGLNAREINEFIIYWLPILESNEYNLIHFIDIDEINAIMPLEVTPKPDTMIRVLMEYKRLDKAISIKEQKLVTPNRSGFTLVEWGGLEIKD